MKTFLPTCGTQTPELHHWSQEVGANLQISPCRSVFEEWRCRCSGSPSSWQSPSPPPPPAFKNTQRCGLLICCSLHLLFLLSSSDPPPPRFALFLSLTPSRHALLLATSTPPPAITLPICSNMQLILSSTCVSPPPSPFCPPPPPSTPPNPRSPSCFALSLCSDAALIVLSSCSYKRITSTTPNSREPCSEGCVLFKKRAVIKPTPSPSFLLPWTEARRIETELGKESWNWCQSIDPPVKPS